ncbi:MAG: putative cell wall associated biofilm protein [Parcubacteria group bacterium Athens0714_16]|nr:MAG: putative cell wall associated biofilm protein [Parcubacteria group bacterium Athens0714_16]
MENRKFVILIIIFLANFVFINGVYSYNGVTHKAITNETIEFYNEINNKKISNEDKEKILLGSVKEDEPFYRSVYHFYDPIYNKGLWGEFLPAYKWAENTKAQAMLSPQYALLSKLMSFFSSNSDYSFDRAVYEYVNGDKQRGLETLGNILHLVEDMAVPAHTRDDQHLNGDYYETYTTKYDSETISDISGELVKSGEKSKKLSSLFDYFSSLANYSNNNFFSGDTINDKKYIEPKIDFEKKDLDTGITFGYKNLKGDVSRVIGIENKISFFSNKDTNIYFLDDDGDLILSDNWSHLSKQAVLHASGVISLFFEKVREEEDTMALFNKNRDSIKKLFGAGLYQSASVGVTQESNGATKQKSNEVYSTVQPVVNNNVVINQESNNQEQNNSVVDEIQTTITTTPETNQQPNIPDSTIKYNVQEPAPITPKYGPGFGGGGAGGGNSRQNTYPTITLTGSAEMTITKGDTYTDAGATASDTEDGGITANIVKTGTVDTATVGTYTISYNVMDSGGLTANEITRRVIVQNLPKPIISTPAVNPYTSATNSITFSGIASSTLLISNDFSTSTTTADGNENWSMSLSGFQEGTTTINFVSSNTSYSTSTVTEFVVFVDTQSPIFSAFSITECGHSISTNGSECLIPTTKINPVWNSNEQNISYYEVYLNNVLATTTTATTTEITIPENSQSEIKVRAVDRAGNERYSDVKQVKTTINMPVIINEIAWAGTSATLENDEWIELYNRSSQEIKMSEFVIFAEDGTPYINLSGTILANSFYLIERTDDTTVNVVANLVTPFSGLSGSGLGNSGEVLSLVYSTGTATTTVDKTPNLVDCGGGWCAGTASADYKTMERINPDISGTISTNWNSNNTYKKNGTNANNGLINGTPLTRNSANVSSSGIGYYCGPYVNTFQEGMTYKPSQGVCTYIFPSFRTVSTYGDIYKGEVGNSIIVNGHSLKNHITTIVESPENDAGVLSLNNEDRIFIAIYEIRQGSNDINDFRNYFKTNLSPAPHSNYSILNWVYGE